MNRAIPFSRPQPVAALARGGVTLALVPSEAERAAIAAFLDIPAVERFEAELTAAPERGAVRVTGEVRATVLRTCVVSLEDFPVAVAETVDVRFAPPEIIGPVTAREVERGLDDEDPPEPLEGAAVDLGAVAVEALALGLDPYPRKPGVEAPELTFGDAPESPFAALAALKKPEA